MSSDDCCLRHELGALVLGLIPYSCCPCFWLLLKWVSSFEFENAFLALFEGLKAKGQKWRKFCQQ
tara:strand:- start:787 stop:981 length:195 start_codon:yes stop_codon:yes gene_type:complete